MVSLSAAAAFAVLALGIALAAGRLTAPRPDPVAAAHGGGTKASAEPTQDIMNQITPEPTPTPMPEITPDPMPTPTPEPEITLVYTQPVSNYYHRDPNCSGMQGAVAWTEASAISVGKQPCPVCIGGSDATMEEPLPTVYYTEAGMYYHGNETCSGMRNAVAHTLIEAEQSGKLSCPVCIGGSDESMEEPLPTLTVTPEQTAIEEAQLMVTQPRSNDYNANRSERGSMSAQEAWEKLVEADNMAEQAGEVWIYLSSEADAAWVFYATDRDEQKLLWTGAAWFVGEKECVCLGRSESIHAFCFFSTRSNAEPDYCVGSLRARSGMHVAYGPELYMSILHKDGKSDVHIWTLGDDGLPLEMDTGKGFSEIESLCGILAGTISPEDDQGDLCFLHAHDGVLYQVSAQTAGIDEVEALPGGAELLAEIRSQGYTVTDCLYRDMDGNIHGAGAAVITVNLVKDGDHSHAYLFREHYGDALQTVRGWGDEIIFYYDAGTFNPDAGLPTLSSSTLETDKKIYG